MAKKERLPDVRHAEYGEERVVDLSRIQEAVNEFEGIITSIRLFRAKWNLQERSVIEYLCTRLRPNWVEEVTFGRSGEKNKRKSTKRSGGKRPKMGEGEA